jgi:predicted murein hydrolase (TIGR00659 family)
VSTLWVYLSASPLLWLAATLVAYQAGVWVYERLGRKPFVTPVPIAVLLLVSVLILTRTSYAAYFEGAKFVHFLLGPATVALAVPLYENRALVRRALVPMLAALVAGSATAIISAVGLAKLLGASRETLLSLAPKSATTPIAMGITEQLGGVPSLTAAFVVLTGMTGAVVATPLLNALGVRDWRGRGFSAGVAAHGLGTARAFEVNEVAGTFAGIALALNGLATSVLVPLLLKLFL